MITEKRWCERIPVSVDVMLHHNGQRLARCAVRDISMCGIRLHSGPLAFYRNTFLRIQFLDAEHAQEQQRLINAMVVRNSADEVALMFDPAELKKLRTIIRNCQRADFATASDSGH